MPTIPFTVIDDGVSQATEAVVQGDSIRVPAEVIGFELKPQGLCRGSLCYPLPQGSTVVSDEGLDLREFAVLSQRPIAIEAGHDAVFLGAAASERGAALDSLEAPDFSLPDLEGNMHSLSDHRGKKVLLVAYASW